MSQQKHRDCGLHAAVNFVKLGYYLVCEENSGIDRLFASKHYDTGIIGTMMNLIGVTHVAMCAVMRLLLLSFFFFFCGRQNPVSVLMARILFLTSYVRRQLQPKFHRKR